MLSERLQLKLLVEPAPHFELEALIPAFHGWIREKRLAELMIDVVDYSHVTNGPGVVLVGHASDFYFGDLDGAYGLMYSRKRGGPSADARLEDALRRLVNGARLLEQDPSLKLKFRTNEATLRLTDRLHAPNDDATFASTKTEVEALFGRIYAGANVQTERLIEPQGPLGLRIKTSTVPSLDALLEKLGGPPQD